MSERLLSACAHPKAAGPPSTTSRHTLKSGLSVGGDIRRPGLDRAAQPTGEIHFIPKRA
jgi:hypothetical protein